MDQTDREILRELEENGRASFTEIAEKVGVSEGTVRNRVEKLKDGEVIKKFTVETRNEDDVEALVSVQVSTDRDFDSIIKDMPESGEILELAGDIDLLIRVSAEGSADINHKVDKIRDVEGVESTNTYMILSKR